MSQRELDLERALADLAASLEFRPTPDLAAAVTARLDQAPARNLGSAYQAFTNPSWAASSASADPPAITYAVRKARS